MRVLVLLFLLNPIAEFGLTEEDVVIVTHPDNAVETLSRRDLQRISKIKYITLLSDANVPVRFRAQQRVSIANHSPRSTVSQLKCVSDTISS